MPDIMIKISENHRLKLFIKISLFSVKLNLQKLESPER